MARTNVQCHGERPLELASDASEGYKREMQLEEHTRGYISQESTSKVLETGLLRSLLEPYTALSIFAMSLGWMAGAWGFNPAAAILTLIAADIGPNSPNSTLFSIVWSMGMAVGYLLVGRLSDICGRRWVIISFNVLGFVGGIVAATAHTLDILIGANVLIGLAAGAQFSAMVTATELMPNKHKMLIMALVLFLVFPGTSLSPYLARRLYETAGWRWVYYIYAIIVGVQLILYFFFYRPKDAITILSIRSRLRRLDFGGMFLTSAGLTLFILGISWGGNPQPWTSGTVLGPLISGFAVLVVLVFYEIYMPLTDPFLPMKLFKDLTGYTPLLIVASSAGIAFVGMHILWPTQVIRLYGQNSDWQTVAWMSSTMGFGTWSATVICGPFWSKIGHVKWQLVFWCVWLTAFTGALANCSPHNKAFAIAISFLAGCPVGYLENQTGMLVQLIAPDNESGTYFGSSQGIRTAAGSVGTAIFVAILNNKLASSVRSFVRRAVLPFDLPTTSLEPLVQALGSSVAARASALNAVPGISPEIIAAAETGYVEAVMYAYKYVYYAVIAFGVWSIIAALVLRPMDHLLTDHVPKSNGHHSYDVKLVSEKMQQNMFDAEKTETVDQVERVPEVGRAE